MASDRIGRFTRADIDPIGLFRASDVDSGVPQVPLSSMTGIPSPVRSVMRGLQSAEQPFSAADQPGVSGTMLSDLAHLPQSKTEAAIIAAGALPLGKIAGAMAKEAAGAESELRAWHGTNTEGVRKHGIYNEPASNSAVWMAENQRTAEYFANGSVKTPPGVLYPGAVVSHEPVNLKNPLIVDMNDPKWAPSGADAKSWSTNAYDTGAMVHEIGFVKEKAARMALEKGHDGVIFKNGYDARPYSGDIYAVFRKSGDK